MEGAARVFAGEFNRATLTVQKRDETGYSYIVTPGGAYCRLLLVSGALTEVSDLGDMLRCRISDPTGAFDVVISGAKKDLFTMTKKIPVPSFLVVVGLAQMHQRNGCYALSVRPESLQIIDRAVRDLWVVRTADLTLRRVESLATALDYPSDNPELQQVIGHYSVTRENLRDLVVMADSALLTIRTSGSPVQPPYNPRDLITTILQKHQGSRGVAIEEITQHAVLAGISPDAAKAAIEEMIKDDTCYQPQKGVVKLL
jgi:RPA family protein